MSDFDDNEVYLTAHGASYDAKSSIACRGRSDLDAHGPNHQPQFKFRELPPEIGQAERMQPRYPMEFVELFSCNSPVASPDALVQESSRSASSTANWRNSSRASSSKPAFHGFLTSHQPQFDELWMTTGKYEVQTSEPTSAMGFVGTSAFDSFYASPNNSAHQGCGANLSASAVATEHKPPHQKAHSGKKDRRATARTSKVVYDSDTVRVYPRAKAGQDKVGSDRPPVVVTRESLAERFDRPLSEVCLELGLCATAVKKICRKLGIEKWPFKEQKVALRVMRESATLATEQRDDPVARAAPEAAIASGCEGGHLDAAIRFSALLCSMRGT